MRLLLGLLIFASLSVWGEEVHLVCSGTDTQCSGDAWNDDAPRRCDTINISGEMKFDEAAGTMHYKRFEGDFKKAKDVKFSDSEISGKVRGDIRSIGQSIQITLNRYTGIVTTELSIAGASQLRCERVAQERLF